MKAPFPYFGGKRVIAPKVWDALGNPAHYIEPFFGSGAVLLNRPEYDGRTETVNDKDGLLCNVWRALQFAPDEVAKWCDWPVNHADLNARRIVLNKNSAKLCSMLEAYDDYYDAKLAGYWIWAASCWIGSGLTRKAAIPLISNAGRGVHSKIPLISNAGRGVHSQIPHIGDAGQGVRDPYNAGLWQWFRELSERLRNVRVVCGDWTRVCGGSWHDKMGDCGFFFDPPYGVEERDSSVYHHDSTDVAKDVLVWCLEHGPHPNYRIVLCGYEEHAELLTQGWTSEAWKTNGGYANTAQKDSTAIGKANSSRERIYYSPHCIKQT